MWEIVGALGLVAFAITSMTIGVRCTLLGMRTGRMPELSIGLGFLIGAVVGYVPETIVLSSDLLPADLEPVVLAITQVAIRGAAVAIVVFTVVVFRRGKVLAQVFAGALLLSLAVSWLFFPYTLTQAESRADVFWYDVFTVTRCLCAGWGALESFRHFAKVRLQQRLGLADPVLTNRFLLWGLGLGAVMLLMATTMLAPVFGMDARDHGWVALESAVGLFGAVSLWLTFFPPAVYKAWLVRDLEPVG